MTVSQFIRNLPKAELHVHIEGTFEPELMLAIARRNGISLPFSTVDETRAAYRFSNLQDFLDIYYQGVSALQTEKDFRDLTCAYFDRVAVQNVRHAEIFFDPQAHTARGIPFATVCRGIVRGLKYAQQTHGITSRLIMCFLRHLDEMDAFATLEQAMPFQRAIYGVGLDSGEAGNPPGKFARVFAAARAAGFRCVAHAGEEGPSDYVEEAVDLLGVQRIDHGNRALEDPALTARLAELGMPLTVCPLSNHMLGVVGALDQHPLLAMLEAGLSVTLNSDDPAYFGGYVNDNYQAMQDHLAVDDATLARIAQNSFHASFLEPQRRAELLAELDAYLRAGASA
ncbi:MAG: adenosine deaminase [Chloroflexi bacterium]|nr:adenosine deaminase [Chloroflexota bacterium]